MTKPHICSIDGCDKPVQARGWCGTHWMRWRRHGDPNYAPDITPVQKFVRDAAHHTGSECLIWPFPMHGKYKKAKINIDGKWHNVPRLICIMAHGEPPTTKHEAAHNCGNGNIGCVNPRHLRWATKIDNEADKLIHGTRNRGARHGRVKLTEDDVLKIRDFIANGDTDYKIASKFGVSRATIHCIRSKETWAWL